MATTGTLNKPADAAGEQALRPPNRVAQLAAADIAAAEARAKVLQQAAPAEQAFTAAASAGAPAATEESSDAAPEIADLDIDVSDAPPLRPMKTMRIHERAKVLAEFVELAGRFDGKEVDVAAGASKMDPAMLSLMGDVDLLLEKYSVDPEAYKAWSMEVDGMDAFLRVMALFQKFVERLGG